MKVRLVANWQASKIPCMEIELPCLPPKDSIIDLDLDYEGVEYVNEFARETCEDFLDKVEEITGSRTSQFLVDEIWVHVSNNIPTIYVVQDDKK